MVPKKAAKHIDTKSTEGHFKRLGGPGFLIACISLIATLYFHFSDRSYNDEEHRARLVIDHIEAPDQVVANQPLTTKIVFRNVGSLLSRDTKITGATEFIGHVLHQNTSVEIETHLRGTELIGPGLVYEQLVGFGPLSQHQIDEVTHFAGDIVIHGHVNYRDTHGAHWLRFCDRIDVNRQIIPCPGNNDSD